MGKKKVKRAVIEEEEYQVEKIIDRRENNGEVEYFLKWKGFSELENTWEPEDNLNCTELLEEFNREYAKNSSKNKEGKSEASSKHVYDEKPGKRNKETISDSERKGKLSRPTKEKTNLDIAENKEKKEKDKKSEDKDERGIKRKATKSESSPKKKKRTQIVTGFDKGYQAQSILGATDTAGGELHFLISWANTNEAELVPARIANLKIPQMVIKFYEERLIWTNGNSRVESDDSKKDKGEEGQQGAEKTQEKKIDNQDSSDSNGDAPVDSSKNDEPQKEAETGS